MPDYHRNAAMTCLKPAPWSRTKGVCVLPKDGHGKRCHFIPTDAVTLFTTPTR